jgi:glycine/D-amino acid oxidase-like deaminating enzyme
MLAAMMVPLPEHVGSDTDLPDAVDVVVIGGGIIGTCTALELAERGLKVALFEKGRIAGEQSGRNWGWCRQMGRDSREMPLIVESLKLWRGMNQRTGADTGFKQCGIAYMEADEKGLQQREAWAAKNARPFQINSRIVRGDELDKLVPGASSRFAGALYTDSDGRAEPQRAAPAIADAARNKGAHIFTGWAVRGIETEAGKVSGVMTERGRVRCTRVVYAGGAWSRRFLGNLGLDLPQLITLSNVQATEPVDLPYATSFAGGKYAVRKRADGGYTIAHNAVTVSDIIPASFKYLRAFLPALRSEWPNLKLRIGKRFISEAMLASHWSLDEMSPFEKVRVLDPEPVDWVLRDCLDELARDHPGFKGVRIASKWAGVIDVTPDAVPVISGIDQIPGLFLSTGFSGHGFGIGPGAGRLMADLVTGKTPMVDPAPFSYTRMIDGSKLMPETDI